MRPWASALVLLAASPPARAESPDGKKALLRVLKVLPFPRPARLPSAGPVTLFSLRTREALPVLDGAPPSQVDWSRLLRCHFTGTIAWVDPRLAAEAVAAARKFGADRVEIISGYRDPK